MLIYTVALVSWRIKILHCTADTFKKKKAHQKVTNGNTTVDTNILATMKKLIAEQYISLLPLCFKSKKTNQRVGTGWVNDPISACC